MQALNFLYERPLVNWLDFFVQSDNLVKYFEQPKQDPPLNRLVVEFCEQAKVDEKEAESSDYSEAERNYRRIKASKLWLLALCCCSKVRWNLEKIFEGVSLSIQRDLMDRLVLWTDCGERQHSTEHILLRWESAPNWQILSNQQLFGLWIYARWTLSVDLIKRRPEPAFKVSVSNPFTQPDPNQAFAENEKAVLGGIRQLLPICVCLLERWSQNFGAEVQLPELECFLPVEDTSMIWKELHAPNFNAKWSAIGVGPTMAQVKYDLAQYYFSERRYTHARSAMEQLRSLLQQKMDDEHLSIDGSVVDGYSTALGLQECPKPALTIVGESPSNEMLEKLKSDKGMKVSMVSRFCASKRPSASARLCSALVSDNCILEMRKLMAVTSKAVNFFTNKQNAQAFVQALEHKLPSLSQNELRLIVVYLKYLGIGSPHLRDALASMSLGNDLNDRLSFSPHPTLVPEAPTSAMVFNYKIMRDDFWQLLTVWDPSDLKMVLPSMAGVQYGAQPFRDKLPARFCVPVLFEPILNRMPPGPPYEFLTLLAAKMQQLGALGKIDEWQRLATACMGELRQANLANDTQINAHFTEEALRIELEEWHSRLSRPGDSCKFGQVTQELATKVKGFINLAAASTIRPSAEISALVAAFLINTSDREFLMACDHFPSRFMDLAKMLAAFCHALEKDQAAVRQVAKTFYQVMLPTMEDSGQQKRTSAGMGQTVQRESARCLLTRLQLISIVRYIREQTAISLVLSFCGKLFNCVHNEMQHMFTEHASLWPGNEGSNINEPFLNEIIWVTLENGLLINPNNAFYLRSKAEFLLAKAAYASALELYLQCLVACSDCFVKPLPENVVDDTMLSKMMKCCSKLGCHTQEALLCQLMTEPNEGFQVAVKAMQQTHTFDAQSSYFACIWDNNLFEFLIDVLERTGQKEKLNQALRTLTAQELNCHNNPEVLEMTAAVRKRKFLLALCWHHF